MRPVKLLRGPVQPIPQNPNAEQSRSFISIGWLITDLASYIMEPAVGGCLTPFTPSPISTRAATARRQVCRRERVAPHVRARAAALARPLLTRAGPVAINRCSPATAGRMREPRWSQGHAPERLPEAPHIKATRAQRLWAGSCPAAPMPCASGPCGRQRRSERCRAANAA